MPEATGVQTSAPTLPPVPVPSLKRPRSSSFNAPSSPTGSSSSKKAASEDRESVNSPVLDGTRLDVPPSGMVTLHSAPGPGSSPLRVDVEDDPESDGSEGLAKRTEEVRLNEATGSGSPGLGRERYEELFNMLLSSTPPPFKPYERYFLIPCKVRDDLKRAAFNDDVVASTSQLRLDMSSLIADSSPAEGEEVYIPEQNVQADGGTALSPKGRKERFWSLKSGQVEDEDFLYITESGWKSLSSALGADAGPSLGRFCLSGGRIQLEPPIYTLYHVPGSSPPNLFPAPTSGPLRFSCPTDTPIPVFIRLARSVLTEQFYFDKSNVYRAWQFESRLPFGNNDGAAIEALKSLDLQPAMVPALASKLVVSSGETSSAQTCADRNFEDGDCFILEFGKPLGRDQTDWVLDVSSSGEALVKPTANLPPVPTAPPPLFSKPAMFAGSNQSSNAPTPSGESSASGSSFGMTTRGQAKKVARTKGLVGLVNLGNTCFMNSATQCLSNTVELSDYFLSGVYQEELNRDNPLGMYGQVAEAFGGVVKALWSDNSSSFSPRQLKHTTSRFAPQFAGYGQHDTQEFIAFLLDCLHEDLNRIQKKPYIEKPDWKAGGGDKELAELGKECWTGYKKRNDSVIVDLFQGQLMSTLVCPECHKESITMDPFMYLTVPLPISQHREFKYTFVPRDLEKPAVRGKLLISANASFSQVKEKLALLTKCNPSHIIGFDLWKNTIYNWWIDSDHNSEAKQHDDPIFYDIGVPTSSSRKSVGTLPADGSVTVPVFTVRSNEGSRGRAGEVTEGERAPFFITLSRTEACDAMAVREAIARGYTRYIKQEMHSTMWVSSTSSHAVVPLPVQEGDEKAGVASTTGADIDQLKELEMPARSNESEAGSRPHSPVHDLRTSKARNSSSTSLSTLASVKSGKIVPRGDLYQVHVADAGTSLSASSVSLFKSKDPVVPLYQGGDPRKASSSWSLLEARRKAKKSVIGRFASGISSIVNPSHSPDEDVASSSAPNGSKEGTAAHHLVPVVRPGEAIFCEWPTKTFAEYFTDTVRIDELVDPAIEKERAKKKEGKAIGIEDCLDEFSKEETLGQEDLWYCPVCKKHQAATKRLEIYKAPDILVICIKRFGSSRRLSDKLDNLVNFPIEGLNMEERIGERRLAKSMQLTEEQAKEYGIDGSKESWVYDLYAVDNHFGGLGGGHYTAFCKNKEDGEWYNYDDSRVSRASEQSIQSRAAYLLFYRRRTVRPIGGISRVKAEEALSRSASRVASPAPSSPPTGPSHSGLRNQIEPDSSSAASPLSTASSSDEGLPSYSARDTLSPPPSPPTRGSDAGLQLNIDSSDDESTANVDLRFVRAGQPYGGAQWGLATSDTRHTGMAAGVSHPFALSSGSGPRSRPAGAPPSPPDSDDGFVRLQMRQEEAGKMRADHPAKEALAAAGTDVDVDVELEEMYADTAPPAASTTRSPTDQSVG